MNKIKSELLGLNRDKYEWVWSTYIEKIEIRIKYDWIGLAMNRIEWGWT